MGCSATENASPPLRRQYELRSCAEWRATAGVRNRFIEAVRNTKGVVFRSVVVAAGSSADWNRRRTQLRRDWAGLQRSSLSKFERLPISGGIGPERLLPFGSSPAKGPLSVNAMTPHGIVAHTPYHSSNGRSVTSGRQLDNPRGGGTWHTSERS